MSQKKEHSQYAAYKQYYPDKWAAISVLRRETGMGFSEANRVINELFGMTDDDERIKDDAAQEKIYQAQQAQVAEVKTMVKKGAKRAGIVAGVGLWATIKTILRLTKEYE